MRLIALCLLLVVLVGCEQASPVASGGLPTGATNVQDEGNGWQTFEWRGKKFLYHKFQFYQSRSESFCEISNGK